MLLAAPASGDGATSPSRLWSACIIQSARNYAPSNETADTIADAALADCALYEQQAKQELLILQVRVYQHGAGGIYQKVARAEAATDRTMDDMRRQMRGAVISVVIEERSKLAAQAPQP
jgi:hypothetical protein